jgi:hypothetical protein
MYIISYQQILSNYRVMLAIQVNQWEVLVVYNQNWSNLVMSRFQMNGDYRCWKTQSVYEKIKTVQILRKNKSWDNTEHTKQ